MKSLQKFCTLMQWVRETTSGKAALLVFLTVVLFAAFVWNICTGSTALPLKEALFAFLENDVESSYYRIPIYVRLPRGVGAMAAGAALAVSGSILQSVLNNALAGPSIIGVNAGAGFAVILTAAVMPSMSFFIPTAAFAGAMLASLLIWFIAARTGASRVTIILAGVAVNTILSAGIDTISTLFPDVAVGTGSFMVGSLSGVTISSMKFALVFIAVGLVAAYLLVEGINILALGEETARSLGMRTGLMRFVLLIIAAVLAGSAVSFAGLLGFVGLIVPHVARFITRGDNKMQILVSALVGASFVIICDCIARVIVAPFELSVGIIMSFIGGPLFIVLLLKKRRQVND